MRYGNLRFACPLLASITATHCNGAADSNPGPARRTADTSNQIRASEPPSAIEPVLAACRAGDAKRCDELAFAYANGDGVSRDFAAAAAWYDRSCALGHVDGCLSLGIAYAGGHGVAVDLRRAADLYEKACQGGSAGGCFNLGVAYQDGTGVPKDHERAAQAFAKACRGGDTQACAVGE